LGISAKNEFKLVEMLANYTATVIHECVRYGIPAQRPLVLHYEDDPIAVNSKYQYMYGPDLLIENVSIRVTTLTNCATAEFVD
jgi:alpha-glucosidase (family GH31 glycosyl hydrolase)